MSRPLLFLDLETTGVDAMSDRIIELALIYNGESGSGRAWRVNPGRPIPAEATAVHGIRDEDVADLEPFAGEAEAIREWIADADLAGFNIARFDLPLLRRELRDAGHPLDMTGRRVIDVYSLFCKLNPRKLTDAALRYGIPEWKAHSAAGDAAATAAVLRRMLDEHADLPRDVEELEKHIGASRAVDIAGKFVLRDGVCVCNFGKYREQPLADIVKRDERYLRWMLTGDFDPDTLAVVRKALEAVA